MRPYLDDGAGDLGDGLAGLGEFLVKSRRNDDARFANFPEHEDLRKSNNTIYIKYNQSIQLNI